MVITLLDVNVLVAFAWPQHAFHTAARSWLTVNEGVGWATTPLTELGLVRLSCNGHVVAEPLTPDEAVGLAMRLRSRSGHQFWPDSLQVGEEDLDWSTIRTHRQITDARLVALARAHGGRLATFDTALARTHGDAVLLLEA